MFIRAPWVAEHGPAVEVLGSVDDQPVAIRQGNVIAVAFHPELAGETRLHELLLAIDGSGEPARRSVDADGPAARAGGS